MRSKKVVYTSYTPRPLNPIDFMANFATDVKKFCRTCVPLILFSAAAKCAAPFVSDL
uniref:Uncharacterized protein n=2 Tax=Gammaproteobacteria TaxID=1236 RepID=A0A2P9EIA7_ECOLX|nr:protein of unknown function [Escherichia coli]SPE03119.1 protein of unknown function [Escherichia coli]